MNKKIRLTEEQVKYLMQRLNETDGADTPAFDATSQVKTDGVEQGVKKVANQAKQSGIVGARVTVDSGALDESAKCIGTKGKLMEMRRNKLMESSIKSVTKKNLFK